MREVWATCPTISWIAAVICSLAAATAWTWPEVRWRPGGRLHGAGGPGEVAGQGPDLGLEIPCQPVDQRGATRGGLLVLALALGQAAHLAGRILEHLQRPGERPDLVAAPGARHRDRQVARREGVHCSGRPGERPGDPQDRDGREDREGEDEPERGDEGQARLGRGGGGLGRVPGGGEIGEGRLNPCVDGRGRLGAPSGILLAREREGDIGHALLGVRHHLGREGEVIGDAFAQGFVLRPLLRGRREGHEPLGLRRGRLLRRPVLLGQGLSNLVAALDDDAALGDRRLGDGVRDPLRRHRPVGAHVDDLARRLSQGVEPAPGEPDEADRDEEHEGRRQGELGEEREVVEGAHDRLPMHDCRSPARPRTPH
ncbi:hypothetical protein mvi_35720 [Methylobacterium indicum]|uniref:Uncharacterized protein n=1 Tax=Methylobacterium indicum TaxID=1775910 RepID=A0A8H9C7V9_9HYPH|nr:hypothetical protein mvi_35720 [Methylobacterium indicum]